MTATTTCFDDDCGETISGETIEEFEERFLSHIRDRHPELPFPDNAVRNYAAATQRLSDATERLDVIGTVDVHPVSHDRVDDWLELFDHTGFAGNPPWASCYCTEPHLTRPDGTFEGLGDDPRWFERREAMLTMLGNGTSFGYLAYVDGVVAGWVNASLRSNYALYRRGAEGAAEGDATVGRAVGAGDVADERVVGVSCFVIAPPYRRHGLASALLDRVVADAPGRGATHVEAYPFNERTEPHFISADAGEFRGPRGLFDVRGFEPVAVRERDTVVRRALT